MEHTVNEIHKYVMKNKTEAQFQYCENAKLMYSIDVGDLRYTFPIDVTDRYEIGNAIFSASEKASLLMRYFRKASEKLEIREERIN